MDYWAQSKAVQTIINKTIPKKDTWVIDATKNMMCDWVFDIPPFVTNEAITGGSNTIFDAYYLDIVGTPANVGDKMNVTVTTVKPKFHHAVCVDFKPAEGGFGHYYIEQNTQMVGWFCPMFEVMFGDDMPEKVYVTFKE